MLKLNLSNLTAGLVVAVSFALPAAAQEPSGPILFTNVNVFDGVNADLIKNANVVVTGNKITSVSKEPLAVADATGKTEAAREAAVASFGEPQAITVLRFFLAPLATD